MDSDRNIVYTKGYGRKYLDQGFGMSHSENYILLISDSSSLDIEYVNPSDGSFMKQINHSDFEWRSIHCELKFVPNSDAVFFFSVVERNIDQGILCRG